MGDFSRHGDMRDPKFSAWLRRAWDAPPGSPPRGCGILAVLARLYGFGVALNGPRVERATIPVVSGGSIWVGGAGKTPLAAELAALARAEGLRPAIVLRGYRGLVRRGAERVTVAMGPSAARRFGDEACLHAQGQESPVYVAPRRIEGVRLAAREGSDLAILDDGMQHRSLARALEIVSLPAECPFGNGWLLPRGPLREPPTALARADLIVLAYVDRSGVRDDVRKQLARFAPMAGVLAWRAGLRLRPFAPRDRSCGVPPPGSRVALLCGLGNPSLFRRSMEEAGYRVAWMAAFADHHAYRAGEVEAVMERAATEGLHAVVTTAKDAIRIGSFAPRAESGLFVAELAINWMEPQAEEVLRAKLRTSLQD